MSRDLSFGSEMLLPGVGGLLDVPEMLKGESAARKLEGVGGPAGMLTYAGIAGVAEDEDCTDVEGGAWGQVAG